MTNIDPTSPIDLSPATTVLLQYNARFEYADFSLIRQWINEGCDMHRDIVPAIKACIEHKRDINTVGYFTKAVRRTRDMRLDTERAKEVIDEKKAHLAATADERRAKQIATLVRKLGQRHPTDERWLAEYEAKNGKVEL